MSAAPSQTIALAELLWKTAAELERLAAKASEIDEAVGDLVVATSAGERAKLPLVLLQDVDLLRQSMDCIQIILSNTARHQQCTCSVPADNIVEGVYLAAMRQSCLASD